MSTRFNYFSQSPDLDTLVIGMLSRPQASVKKENARFLLQKISSTQNMVFQPRAAIFCLTLKLVLGGKAHTFVRYSFGMLRGLFKDYQRSLTPKPPQNCRRSKERTQTVQSESPVFTDLGEVIQRTMKFHRKTVTNTRSHNASPRASLHLVNGVDSAELLSCKRAALRAILKIFSKFFNKQFNKLRTSSCKFVRKHSLVRSICRMTLIKTVGSAFGDLKTFRGRQGNLGKSSTSFYEYSRARSPSFETRDKELWKRRHPIRNHSPTPSLIWRPSLANTSQNLSEPSSPRNPFTRKDNRRNTVGVLKKFDTFGTVGSEEFKQQESQSLSKDSEDYTLNSRKPLIKKAEDKEKAKKGSIGKPKASKLRSSRQGTENPKILENALKDIQKNHKAVKNAALVKLTECVESDKQSQRINAATLLGDLIQFSLEKNRESLLKSAVNDMKYIRASVKSRPSESASSVKSRPSESTSSLKSLESLKKPALGPKRQDLRSGKPSKPSPKDQALDFLQKLDFVNTSALKSKLIAFLNLIEGCEPAAPKPELKGAFRSIFRILEKKRFSKAYQAFHSVKRQASHKQQSKKLQLLKFSQKLDSFLSSSTKSLKRSAFRSLFRSHAYPAGLSKLHKIFYKTQSRLSSILLLKAWYAVSSYSKKSLLTQKFQQAKTQSWRTASPTASLYSTQTAESKRTLPLPKDIHDYIDDLYEVGQSNKAAKYLSPSSSIRTIKMHRNN